MKSLALVAVFSIVTAGLFAQEQKLSPEQKAVPVQKVPVQKDTAIQKATPAQKAVGRRGLRARRGALRPLSWRPLRGLRACLGGDCG